MQLAQEHTIKPLHALTQGALIAASGTPTVPVLVLIWSVVMVVAVAC